MMKTARLAKIVSLGLALTVSGLTASGLAAARTQPANLGNARIGAQANLFNYNFTTGEVTATLPATLPDADWALGLVLDNFGGKQIVVNARAVAAGASVRAVSATNTGTFFMATAFVPLPTAGGAGCAPLALGPLTVPTGGVAFLDAIMNNGASICRVEYNP